MWHAAVAIYSPTYFQSIAGMRLRNERLVSAHQILTFLLVGVIIEIPNSAMTCMNAHIKMLLSAPTNDLNYDPTSRNVRKGTGRSSFVFITYEYVRITALPLKSSVTRNTRTHNAVIDISPKPCPAGIRATMTWGRTWIYDVT